MINFYVYHNEVLDKREEYEQYFELLHRELMYPRLQPIQHIIKKIPYHAVWYAVRVIKGRWIEAEPYIMKHSYYSYAYAKFIIEGRWLEAEDIIKTDDFWWGRYCEVFDI